MCAATDLESLLEFWFGKQCADWLDGTVGEERRFGRMGILPPDLRWEVVALGWLCFDAKIPVRLKREHIL